MVKEIIYIILSLGWILSFFINKRRNTVKGQHKFFLIMGLIVLVLSFFSIFGLFGF
jgi:hypothetical protein